MSEVRTLALCGGPGTGKSTQAEYLKGRYGFAVFEGSDILRERARTLGRSLTSRESYNEFYREQQRHHGLSWMAGLVLQSNAAQKLQAGLRSRPDFERIKAADGTIVGFVCPPNECVARIDTTNPKNPQSVEEYEYHQQIERSDDVYGTHTEWCVKNADYIIDTSQPIADVQLVLGHIVTGQLHGIPRIARDVMVD